MSETSHDPATIADILTTSSVHLASDTIDRIAALGVAAAGAEVIEIPNLADDDGLPSLVPAILIHGTDPKVISARDLIAQWRIRPARKTGTATALTLDSLIALANRHKTADSVIFAITDWLKPSITAVIDYHGAAPANLCHRIRYEFPLSEAWKFWSALHLRTTGMTPDGRPGGTPPRGLSQAEFAALLEDRIVDLASPTEAEAGWIRDTYQTTCATPAEVMQLARGLTIHVDSTIRQAVTLQSGEASMAFSEAHKDSGGAPLKIPGVALLSIPPFDGGAAVRIPLRLRYRVSEGKAVWYPHLYRPDQFVVERISDDLDHVADRTGLPVYAGTPEA